MVFTWKAGAVAIGLAGLVSAAIPAPASAITAELARSCKLLTTKRFPPREPTNPAAGSAKGSGREQQAYFEKCVANNGKVDADGPK